MDLYIRLLDMYKNIIQSFLRGWVRDAFQYFNRSEGLIHPSPNYADGQTIYSLSILAFYEEFQPLLTFLVFGRDRWSDIGYK